MIDNKTFLLQFEGYKNTPLLWKNDNKNELKQLILNSSSKIIKVDPINVKLPLGKLVEHFVFNEFQNNDSIKLKAKNIQIIEDKKTLGELDCIIEINNQLIHLEIVYKFYLFDKSAGELEIQKWIGPNRNDKLEFKIAKLQNKQLPLLLKKQTILDLKKINIKAENIIQRVLFKAQLYIPFNTKIDFEKIEKECVKGFYIRLNEISNLIDCKFYIPTKLDWLIEVHNNVDWIIYDNFKENINHHLNNKRSSLCWIKFPTNEIEKFFVVWW